MQTMKKHLVFFVRRFEWSTLIMGVIFVGVSFGLIFHTKATIYQLAMIIGFTAISKGFMNFNLYSLTYLTMSQYRFKWWFLVSASLDIVIGLLLIFSFFSSEKTLLILTGSWIVSDSIPHLLLHLKIKQPTKNIHYGMIAANITCIGIGIFLFILNHFSNAHIAYFLIPFYLLAGIALISQSQTQMKKGGIFFEIK